jgi:hypothetical protein
LLVRQVHKAFRAFKAFKAFKVMLVLLAHKVCKEILAQLDLKEFRA